MTLINWLKNRWLTEHVTNHQEITELLEIADRDLKDCQASELSADWKLSIAYNAALQAATAALAAAGYRAGREAHHYRIIQSLVHTIQAEASLVNQFDKFRKKRNIGGYERAGATSDQEAGEMITLASKLRKDVEEWLRVKHPHLLES